MGRTCPGAGTGEGSLLGLSLQITSPQDNSEQLLLQGQRGKQSRDAANPVKCVISMSLTDGYHQPMFISPLYLRYNIKRKQWKRYVSHGSVLRQLWGSV